MSTDGSGEKLYAKNENADEQFFDTADVATPDSGVGSQDMSAEEKEKQREEWKAELAKTEEEIQTLRSVLANKVKTANELKKKLGITPIAELKHDVQHTLKTIRESDAYKTTTGKLHEVEEKITHSAAYQKTNQALKTVGEKTSAAASSVGKKIGDIRNSTVMKSFEEKVGSAYSSVKAKVTGSKSENFEEVLSNTANAEKEESQPLPEEKVPL